MAGKKCGACASNACERKGVQRLWLCPQGCWAVCIPHLTLQHGPCHCQRGAQPCDGRIPSWGAGWPGHLFSKSLTWLQQPSRPRLLICLQCEGEHLQTFPLVLSVCYSCTHTSRNKFSVKCLVTSHGKWRKMSSNAPNGKQKYVSSGFFKIKIEVGYSLFWQGRLGLAMGNTELSGLEHLFHTLVVELL